MVKFWWTHTAQSPVAVPMEKPRGRRAQGLKLRIFYGSESTDGETLSDMNRTGWRETSSNKHYIMPDDLLSILIIIL